MRRPLLAAILTIVGGFFIALGGLVLAVVGTVLAAVFGFPAGWFYVGLVAGLLTMGLGGLMLALPSSRTTFGIATLVFAALSIPFAFGGFVIGFLLAVIGGALAIVGWPREPDLTHPPGPAPPWT